jgi:hypothetical protein
VTKVPFSENWTGVADTNLAQYGWSVCTKTGEGSWSNLPADAPANWQSTTVTNLGPDAHYRHNSVPPASNFTTCLVTPSLDTQHIDLPAVAKLEDYLTAQVETSMKTLSSDAEVYFVAWNAADDSVLCPPSTDLTDASSTQIYDGLKGKVSTYGKTWDKQLQSWNLSGTNVWNANTARVGICITASSSFSYESFNIDTVKVAYGLAPHFGFGEAECAAAGAGSPASKHHGCT